MQAELPAAHGMILEMRPYMQHPTVPHNLSANARRKRSADAIQNDDDESEEPNQQRKSPPQQATNEI